MEDDKKRKKRLSCEVFGIPAEAIREGVYFDKCSARTREIRSRYRWPSIGKISLQNF